MQPVRPSRRRCDPQLERAAGQPTKRHPAMMAPRPRAEQQRALAMLASAGRNGVTQPLLAAHGFGAAMIVGFVNQGLAAPREGPRRRQDDRSRQGADHGCRAERDRRLKGCDMRLDRSVILALGCLVHQLDVGSHDRPRRRPYLFPAVQGNDRRHQRRRKRSAEAK
jgi:hypothetical protein